VRNISSKLCFFFLALRTVLHILEGSYLELICQGLRTANPQQWQPLEAVRKKRKKTEAQKQRRTKESSLPITMTHADVIASPLSDAIRCGLSRREHIGQRACGGVSSTDLSDRGELTAQ
jgi:hypothetical protein